MRKLVTPFILSASAFMLFNTASAQSSQGYKTSLSDISVTSLKIDVELSDDLQSRAEGLPKGRTTCSQSRRTNSGFACNGFYGQRDLDALTEKLEKWTETALTKKGINVTDDATSVLKLTLVDVRNNRPTLEQLSHDIGLSFQSFALGGADVSGEFFDANGNSLGTVSYAYYDSFLDEFTRSAGTWSDTRRALQRFSKRVAKDIASHSTTGA
ncbi:MAG: hypothetical protein ABJ275_04035 [Maricaulaceae bacterium]